MQPMRSVVAGAALVLVAAIVAAPAAAETATASVTVTATFSTRTALNVSAQVLQFDAIDPRRPATASVDFAAKARTLPGGEVVLSVEPLHAVDGLDGPAGIDAAVTFEGHGEGTLPGRVTAARPAVAGRWSGSGRRTGRLIFQLRAAARGSYVV
ncbi:MAG TPA: hypothetical protein VG106_10960, partial [Vicinamibacterales bacterium]|nr:hypothetical protein [Vicinamibacterales bacterium]